MFQRGSAEDPRQVYCLGAETVASAERRCPSAPFEGTPIPNLITCLWVAAGGAIGSVARLLLVDAVGRSVGGDFPWGTVIVNISGSLLIGSLAYAMTPLGKLAAPSDLRVFLIAGVCGGYTTFSAFSLQTFALMREGLFGAALCNVALSVAACILATWLGALGARLVLR